MEGQKRNVRNQPSRTAQAVVLQGRGNAEPLWWENIQSVFDKLLSIPRDLHRKGDSNLEQYTIIT